MRNECIMRASAAVVVWLIQTYALSILVACSVDSERSANDRVDDKTSLELKLPSDEPSVIISPTSKSRDIYDGESFKSFNDEDVLLAAAQIIGGAKTEAFEDVIQYRKLTLQQQLKVDSPIEFRTATELQGWYEEYEPYDSGSSKKTLRVEFDYGIVSAVQIWQQGQLTVQSRAEPSGRYSQIIRTINVGDNAVRMLSKTEGQGCLEQQDSEYFFEKSDAVERRYKIQRDICSKRSEIQMWTFFSPDIEAMVPYETVSESVEVAGCQREARMLSYYPNGQLKADVLSRDGLTLEEKHYNERGRRQSNPLKSTLNKVREDLRKEKCNTD